MARRMNEEWQQWYPFVIAAATMDYDWNDFERKETVWRVTLENDKKDQLIATKLEVRKVIRYPNVWTASITRFRVAGLISPLSLMARDTVWRETPAARATSSMVIRRFIGCERSRERSRESVIPSSPFVKWEKRRRNISPDAHPVIIA